MKVIVNVCYSGAKVKSGEGQGNRLSLAVKPTDTVLRLKQRVALVEPVPFPDQVLLLEGAALQDSQRLEELGLKEGQELQFVVSATVAIFTQQLMDLLQVQARPVPANELAMLYSHKCGGTVKSALTILGCSGTFTDFLTSQKAFSVQDSGLVSVLEPAKNQVPETPVTVTTEVVVKSSLGNVVKASVDLKVKACQTVQSLYDRVAAAELIPFQASQVSLDGRVVEGDQQLGIKASGAKVHVQVNISKDMLLQQLAGVLNGRRLSVTELGDLYCYRYGVPVTRALELLGRRSTLKDFLKDNPEHFNVHAGSVVQKEPSNDSAGSAFGGLNQQYLDLDSEITSGKSIQEAEACLEAAIKSATQGSSQPIVRVIRGGSLGRGTAFKDNADAEALLLVNGMEDADRHQWMPPLLTQMAAALREEFQHKAEVSVAEDSVHISFPGSRVSLSLCTVASDAHRGAERRQRLFAKMSPTTKVTMRLLKWWRNQQLWSSGCRPSDLVLEELVASTADTSPGDQVAAVAAVLGAMQSLEQATKTYFDNHQLVQFATQSAGKLIK